MAVLGLNFFNHNRTKRHLIQAGQPGQSAYDYGTAWAGYRFQVQPMTMLEVVVGTYEELLLGYKIDLKEKFYLHDQDELEQESIPDLRFEQSFTDHSHIGCVKSVTTSKRGYLASGSTDEVIRLFNLKCRKELGSLMHHDGSITKLEFFGKTHMFSSSEDGTVCVWKVGKWECLRTLRGHKGPVYNFAIHPTGKMALSISKDKTMKTWNLMTGRCAYTTNIKLVADLVQWSPDGKSYMIAVNNKLDIYSVETTKIEKTLHYDSRIYVIEFVERDVLLLTGEGGKVQLFDLTTSEKVHELSTDTNRVRGAALCQHDGYHLLATASSDGAIQIWRIARKDRSWSSVRLASHNTNFRLTCLALMKEREKTDGTTTLESETEEKQELDDQSDTPEKSDGKDDSDDHGQSIRDEASGEEVEKTGKRGKTGESLTFPKSAKKSKVEIGNVKQQKRQKEKMTVKKKRRK